MSCVLVFRKHLRSVLRKELMMIVVVVVVVVLLLLLLIIIIIISSAPGLSCGTTSQQRC